MDDGFACSSMIFYIEVRPCKQSTRENDGGKNSFLRSQLGHQDSLPYLPVPLQIDSISAFIFLYCLYFFVPFRAYARVSHVLHICAVSFFVEFDLNIVDIVA